MGFIGFIGFLRLMGFTAFIRFIGFRGFIAFTGFIGCREPGCLHAGNRYAKGLGLSIIGAVV